MNDICYHIYSLLVISIWLGVYASLMIVKIIIRKVDSSIFRFVYNNRECYLYCVVKY